MVAKDILLGLTSLVGSATAKDHLKSINLTGPITVINNPEKLVDRYIVAGGLTADLLVQELSGDIQVINASSDKLSQNTNSIMSEASSSAFITET